MSTWRPPSSVYEHPRVTWGPGIEDGLHPVEEQDDDCATFGAHSTLQSPAHSLQSPTRVVHPKLASIRSNSTRTADSEPYTVYRTRTHSASSFNPAFDYAGGEFNPDLNSDSPVEPPPLNILKGHRKIGNSESGSSELGSRELSTRELSTREKIIPPRSSHAPSQAEYKRVWTRRKLLIFLGILGLIIIAIVVGVAVPLATRKPKNNSTKATGSATPTSTTSLGAAATVSLSMGTPTDFPSTPSSSSECKGSICQPMIAAVQPSSDHSSFVLFARGKDNAIWYRRGDSSHWISEWVSLGGKFKSQPAAVSIEEGRIDVFGVWEDSTMRSISYKKGKWDGSWTSLSGDCHSPPTVCSMKNGRLDLLTLTSSKEVTHQWLENGQWNSPKKGGGWNKMSGAVSSDPVVTCRGDGGMDVTAYANPANPYKLTTRRWLPDQKIFTDWMSFDGHFKGDLSAVAYNENRTDILGLDQDNSIQHASWSPSDEIATVKTTKLATDFLSVMSFKTPKQNRLDAFGIHSSGKLMHIAQANNNWANALETLGGFFNSAPTVVSVNDDTVFVFGIGPNGQMIHNKWSLKSEDAWKPGTWYNDGGSFTTTAFREVSA